MVIAMFLAHLVGDYVLQWDSLAIWKGRALKGALTHGGIVTLITLAFAWWVAPAWWPWALGIGLIHTAIDALWLLNRRLPVESQLPPLPRFVIDQILHFSVIILALVLSGYSSLTGLLATMVAEMQSDRLLAYVFGYVALTMPAWVAVEFSVYGLVRAPTPEFSPAANKYLGIVERGLIATFVLLGQFTLVPLVALPRLVFEGPRLYGTQKTTTYLVEVFISLAAAVAIGLLLKALIR
jgi:Protein of unknown function (DUF3307)